MIRGIYCLLFSPLLLLSQTTPCYEFNEEEFNVSGQATVIQDVVRLTEAVGNQSGFIWSQNLINFDQNFNVEAELFLGTQDFGADGIAFVIQPLSNNEGSLGGGIGYEGIEPSLAIEFDTWWNSGNDPTQQDHVALIANGTPWLMSAHDAYIPHMDVNNLEDGLWHPISISWDSNNKTLSLILDGDLMFSTILDIPELFFGGNPNLYWGFTAATGGANNLQQVKILEYCSFDSNCNTEPPTAPSPQTFCESVSLEDLVVTGNSIQFYDQNTGGLLLDPTSEITENTSVYATQTVDDCESLETFEIEILIEAPNIEMTAIEIQYCDNESPMLNLFNAFEFFNDNEITGFYHSIEEAQSLYNAIENPSNFTVSENNQNVYARIDNDICYEIYTLQLIAQNCTVTVPQGISPNNDGFNDILNIQNLYGVHTNHSLKIYNRYGVCIFEGNDSLKWAGQNKQNNRVPVGTYFYVLSLNNENNDVLTGWVYCNY